MASLIPSDGSFLNKLTPVIWKGGTFTCGLAVFAIALLYFKQDGLLYFPEIGGIPRKPEANLKGNRSPSEYNIPFESHLIKCKDGVSIHSWLLLHPDSQSRAESLPTILFFHGNAGNIGLRLQNANQMYHYLKVNVLLVEYRGYGNSDNCTPSEAGLKLDAEAALSFILSHDGIDSSRLFLFGQSLGGAVAFHLAQYAAQQKIPIAGIIVENTFMSISKMVDHLLPYVAPFKWLVLRIGWDSTVIVPKLKVPVMYLAGDADQLVPHSHMLALYQASRKTNSLVQMHIVKGGTHNDTWFMGKKEYWDKQRAFMTQAMSAEKPTFDKEDTCPETVDSAKPLASVGMGGDGDGSNESATPTMLSKFFKMTKEATSRKKD